MLYERLARPALFRLGHGDAEAAHERTVHALALASRKPAALAGLARILSVPGVEREVFGLRFPNPVGVAAGMDKNGVAVPAWPALGFGFAEIGTVTWHPQPGNPKPRLFRLKASEAVVNRMGFNNEGAQALADRLAGYGPRTAPLGISIGKSKVTALEDAVDDYVASLKSLYPYGDYFAVNISSPNTPGLRELQDRGHLDALLTALRAHGDKPLLVKIAPDLSQPAIAELLEVCLDRGVDGIIATNTTIGREGVAPADGATAAEAGGLSGRPLLPLSLGVVEFIVGETGGRLPVIGVGGILEPEDALRFFDAGASLVQVFTGLIYRGPGLVRAINKALAAGRSE